MKTIKEHIEIDTIGGARKLTKEDESAFSDFIKKRKAEELQLKSLSTKSKSTNSNANFRI